MELLERYLQAVRFFLPQKDHDDILRELSENLIAQMDDRADGLGRPLDEGEQAEILRAHGHPMIVATRYRPRRNLIGPTFFPVYLLALKMGLGAALLVTAVLAGVTGVLNGDPLREVGQGLLAYPGRALMVFAWTTLGFALLGMAAGRVPTRDWDPRMLPKVVSHELRIPRLRTLFELVVVLVCLMSLLILPFVPVALLGPAGDILRPGPIWRFVYVPIVLLTAMTALLHMVNFVKPFRTPATAVARLGINFVSFILFAFLMRTGELFVARSPGAAMPSGAPVERLVEVVNASCQIGFLIAVVVSLVGIIREVYRINSGRHASLPSTSGHAPGAR
jgi:hypothetical protein